MIIFFYMFNYNMIKGLYISYISCHSLYSLFVVSTITHQKRLGLDSIHGLSVDNQIFCTTKDLSVLSGALVHFWLFYVNYIWEGFLQSWKGNNLKLVQSTKPLFKSWSNFLHQESENIQNHDCGLTLILSP